VEIGLKDGRLTGEWIFCNWNCTSPLLAKHTQTLRTAGSKLDSRQNYKNIMHKRFIIYTSLFTTDGIETQAKRKIL